MSLRSAPSVPRAGVRRFIFVARYFSIEPLGILYLCGVLRDMGWDAKVVLIHNEGDDYDFEPLYDAVRDFNPSYVGFQIWTGWHLQSFQACDQVRAMGVPVLIGGPHATYFYDDCSRHADWVVKASGFGLLRQIVEGLVPTGVHFNSSGRGEHFPLPDRDTTYRAYSELAKSPIKSMFASVGCPFTCTYCYAPTFNDMHGGFALTVRPVDELIAEARDIMERWPLELVYFQDDIFGYNLKWLEEFATRWRQEVGVNFHAQIRLELTRNDNGLKRLDLFREAGCTGLTVAIESGSRFMRDRVLFRHMPTELILDGCERIMTRGMTLRTEQILAIPFSDLDTDLSTLDLNNDINPTMAWCSLLAPYGGTDIGTICRNFGFHTSNNDDLRERSYERSTLQHPAGGIRDIEPIVESLGVNPSAPPDVQPLLNMRTERHGDMGDVYYTPQQRDKGGRYVPSGPERSVGRIEYLSEADNEEYRTKAWRVQRHFNVLSKMPAAAQLGRELAEIGDNEWSWEAIGRTMTEHMQQQVSASELERRMHSLASEMELASPYDLPEVVAQNPHFFTFFPSGGELARRAVTEGVLTPSGTADEMVDNMSTLARRHLFHRGLYGIGSPKDPIAVK